MTKNLSLYTLSSQYDAVLEMLDDPDVPEDAILDTLEAIEAEIDAKAQNAGYVILSAQNLVAGIKEREKAMAARRKALENKVARIKDYIHKGMAAKGVLEISCEDFSIKVKKNPPSVEIVEESVIPREFMQLKSTYTPMKKEILAALKDGQSVPGCILNTNNTRIEIK